jgi:hypothetical protein
VWLEGEKTVRLLDTNKLFPLDIHYFDFYNRRIDAFIFADVHRLVIKKPDGIYEFAKVGSQWRLEKPTAATIENSLIEDILRNCAWIMADRVLAEASLDERKKYGCMESLEITILDQSRRESATRCIEIGKELDKTHCAVWISGFPYIYQIGIRLKHCVQKAVKIVEMTKK